MESQDRAVEIIKRELALLLTERENAITSCNFPKAQALDCHIAKMKEQIKASENATNTCNAELEYQVSKEKARLEALRIYQFYQSELYAKKAIFQDRMKQMIETHQRQKEEFAEKYAKNMELTQSRTVVESNYLLRQAQFNARNKNYNDAEFLYQQSSHIRKSVTERKESELIQTYDMLQEQLYSKQENEMEICKKKEIAAIEEMHTLYNKDMQRIKLSLSKIAKKLKVKPTGDEEQIFAQYVLTDELDEQIKPQRTPTKTPKSSAKNTPKSSTKSAKRTLDLTPSGTPMRPQSRAFTPISSSKVRKTPSSAKKGDLSKTNSSIQNK